MPFKKGTSGNPIGRPKGSVSTTTKLIREHISQAIDGNKIMEQSIIILKFTELICIHYVSIIGFTINTFEKINNRLTNT